MGGHQAIVGCQLQHGHFSAKTFVKMKELDPVGGCTLAVPPGSTNISVYLHKNNFHVPQKDHHFFWEIININTCNLVGGIYTNITEYLEMRPDKPEQYNPFVPCLALTSKEYG